MKKRMLASVLSLLLVISAFSFKTVHAESSEMQSTGGVYAKKNGTFKESAKLRNLIYFADWSKATNLAKDGSIQVGTKLVVSPVEGYNITVTVTKLAPFRSTDVYRDRLKKLGYNLNDTNYDPNATNAKMDSNKESKFYPKTATSSFNRLYRESGYDTLGYQTILQPKENNMDIGITFSFSATFHGKEVPVQALVADGESIAESEAVVATTDGEPFRLIDMSRSGSGVLPTQPISDPKKFSDRYTSSGYKFDAVVNDKPYAGQDTKVVGPYTTENFMLAPIFATRNVKNLSAYTMSGGAQGVVLGFLVPFDTSDGESSYGNPAHFVDLIPSATSGAKLGTLDKREEATVEVNKNAKSPSLGTVRPDPDSTAKNTEEYWKYDDNHESLNIKGDEGEEQLTGGKYATFYRGVDKEYKLSVIAKLNGADSANVSAWVDFDQNGTFDKSEQVKAKVTKDGLLTLDFGKRTGVKEIGTLNARVRIATDAKDVENPIGIAKDGEVEDFQIPVESLKPTADKSSTTGKQGQVQTSKVVFGSDEDATSVNFNKGTKKTEDGTIDVSLDEKTLTLLDSDGKETKEVAAIDGNGKRIGRYVLKGEEIKFYPEADFVGTAPPVKVQVQDINGTKAETTYTPTVIPAAISSKNAVSEDIQGETQKGKPTFTSESDVVTFNKFKLIEGGKEVDSITVKDVGKYTVDNKTGEVTFTPEKIYKGTAPSVTVQATDSNGSVKTATYTPTVIPVVPTGKPATTTDVQGKQQKQETSELFEKGKATLSDGSEKSVDLDKSTITLLNKDGKKVSQLEVTGKDGKKVGTYKLENQVITFTPEKDFVGTAPSVRVQIADKNGTTAETTYTPIVTPVTLTGENTVSTAYKGEIQTGTPKFTSGDDRVKITEYSLVDPKTGDKVDTVTVDGEGVYKIDKMTGKVTFTPEKDFVGVTKGVTVKATNENGNTATATYIPTVLPLPVGEGVTSIGEQGQIQTGTPIFKNGDGSKLSPSKKNPAKIVVGGVETDKTDIPAVKNGKQVGTYTLDSSTGKVTFVPEKDFVGTPDPITVQVKNEHGKTARATYTPTVTPVVPTAKSAVSTGKQGEAQTGTPEFKPGSSKVPMKSYTLVDGKGNDVKKVTVDGEGTYTIDPKTGKVIFVPENKFVGTAKPVTVKGYDENGTSTTTTYTPTVIPDVPTGEDVTSTGKQGEIQRGTPKFKSGSNITTIDSYTLIDKDGKPVEKITVPNEGIYTIDPKTGRVTFVPERKFVGKANGVTVQATDSNGTTVTAKYTPTVIPVTPVGENATSIGYKNEKQKGMPTFRNGDGSELKASKGNPARFVVDGKVTDETTVAATYKGKIVGKFTVVPETGEIIFTPNKDYVGKVDPVMIQINDENGTPARATYQPEVLDGKADKFKKMKKPPKTGDRENIYLYAWLMVATGSLSILKGIKRRKNTK